MPLKACKTATFGIHKTGQKSTSIIKKILLISSSHKKRGSSTLRKVGFETMTCLVMQKKCGDPVYDFIKKKQAEGKACKVAKIAGFNKFLRIYYARVMEVYQ